MFIQVTSPYFPLLSLVVQGSTGSLKNNWLYYVLCFPPGILPRP